MSTPSEPNKTTGQYHSVKGNLVEAVGNLTGAQTWKDSGKQEHAAGEGEIKAAQIKGYAEGTADRVAGKFDSVTGSVTGDKTKQISGEAQQTKGTAQQKANE